MELNSTALVNTSVEKKILDHAITGSCIFHWIEACWAFIVPALGPIFT